MIAANSPRRTARFTSLRTVIVRSPERNRRVSPRVSMIGIPSFMLAADCSRGGRRGEMKVDETADQRRWTQMSKVSAFICVHLRSHFLLAMLVMIAVAAGCDGGGEDAPAKAADPTPAAPTTATTTTTDSITSKGPRVVFLGDSLTAGLGVERDEAYPAIVTEMLRSDGIEIVAVNAGQSGDTTAGGLRRLAWLLKQKPDVLVVGLGGNDGLRGVELRDRKSTRLNS